MTSFLCFILFVTDSRSRRHANNVWSIVSNSSRLEKCILCRGGVSKYYRETKQKLSQNMKQAYYWSIGVECALLANCTTKNLPLFINTLSSDQKCFYVSCIWKNRKFSACSHKSILSGRCIFISPAGRK